MMQMIMSKFNTIGRLHECVKIVIIYCLFDMQKFGSTESFEKLHPTPSGEENYIALQPSPQSEVKFDNPMYSMKEQLGDFSDKEC